LPYKRWWVVLKHVPTVSFFFTFHNYGLRYLFIKDQEPKRIRALFESQFDKDIVEQVFDKYCKNEPLINYETANIMIHDIKDGQVDLKNNNLTVTMQQ
jgi:hypothetical protein